MEDRNFYKEDENNGQEIHEETFDIILCPEPQWELFHDNLCWPGCFKRKALQTLLEHKSTQLLWKTLWSFHKTLKIKIHMWMTHPHFNFVAH